MPPLPGLTPNGRRVVMMRGVDLEQIAATVADGMKVVLMIGDIRLKEEHIGVAGDVYILDASVATPQNFATHFAKFTPSLIKKFLICVQVTFPLRYPTYPAVIAFHSTNPKTITPCQGSNGVSPGLYIRVDCRLMSIRARN